MQNTPLQISALPGDGLCVYSRDQVVFLNFGEEDYKEVGVFGIQKRLLDLTFDEVGISVVEKGIGEKSKIHVFDFAGDDFPKETSLIIDGCIRCVRLGNRGVVVALEDGHLVCYPVRTQKHTKAPGHVQLGEIASPSAITSIGLDTDQRVYLVACGSQDGTVGLWTLKFSDAPDQLKHEEIFRQTIHRGVVTALSFAGPDILLTGSRDKKICRLDIPYVGNSPAIKQTYELRLQCSGMKIDGVRSEKERAVLKAAMQSSELMDE